MVPSLHSGTHDRRMVWMVGKAFVSRTDTSPGIAKRQPNIIADGKVAARKACASVAIGPSATRYQISIPRVENRTDKRSRPSSRGDFQA